MITDPLKLFVVEYSITQDATHVRSLRKMVENNLYNLGNGQPSDYLPIGLFLTREQADTFCVHFRQGIDQDFQGASGTRHNWRRIRDIAEELLPRHLNNLDSNGQQG
jgi:hypothetical protein